VIPNSAGSEALGHLGIGGQGLMTGFAAPTPPAVPILHPMATITSTTYTWSDGGTVTYVQKMNWSTADGGTYSSAWIDTVTFSYVAIETLNTGASSLHVYRHDDVTDTVKATYGDGTGYTRFEQTDSQTTYDSQASGNTVTYTIDSSGSDTANERQRGVTTPGAGDNAVYSDWMNSTNWSHFDATVSNGQTVAHYSSEQGGNDGYTHTDVGPGGPSSSTSISTLDDRTVGEDSWSYGDAGQFNGNSNGTYVTTNTVTESGGGTDVYVDLTTLDTTSSSSGSVGSTQLIDQEKTSDTGSDMYVVSATGTDSIAVDGTLSVSEQHNDSDSGSEDYRVTDKGLVAMTQFGAAGTNGSPDITTTATIDNFADSSDDQSTYSDSDVETPGAIAYSSGNASPIEDDQFKSRSGDDDTFNTKDSEQVVLTSTAPAGAVTTVTITNVATDEGDVKNQDAQGDDETLPTATTGEVDDFTFDDSAGEQDTAWDAARIVITVVGLVSSNDYVDSTETITLGGAVQNSDSAFLDGTESDTSTSENEQDKLTADQDVQLGETIDDVIESTETVIGFDGTVTTTETNDHSDDAITGHAVGESMGQHADGSAGQFTGFSGGGSAGSGAFSTTVSDHTASSAGFSGQDEFNDNDTVTTTVWQPVVEWGVSGPQTVGTLMTTNTLHDGANDFTTDNDEQQATGDSSKPAFGPATSASFSNTTTSDITDANSDANVGQGYAVMQAHAPGTGVATTVMAGDVSQNSSEVEVSADTTDKLTGGTAGGSSFSHNETDELDSSDKSNDSGAVEIEINGSPQPGVTSNFDVLLKPKASGSDTLKFDATSDAIDSGNADSKFESADRLAVAGKSDGTITSVVNTNDGQENSVTSSDTVTEGTVVGGVFDDSDRGEEVFSTAAGQSTIDNEADTDKTDGQEQVNDDNHDTVQATINAVDPATGVKTTIAVNESGADDSSGGEGTDSTDLHAASVDNSAGGDTISGEDDVTKHENASQNGRLVITTQGTDAQGNLISQQETIVIGGTVSDDIVNDNAQAANGVETGTVEDNSTGSDNVSDVLASTVTVIDPTSGIKTVTTLSLSIIGSSTRQDDQVQTMVSTGPGVDVTISPTSLVGSGTATVTWNMTETIVQTNPDGTSLGSPTTVTVVGTDTVPWQTSLVQGPSGQVVQTVTASDTGNNNSSDPTVGNTSWSNRVFDDTTLGQVFDGASSGGQSGTQPSDVPAPILTYFRILYGEEGQALLKAFHDAGGKVVMEPWMFLGAESDFDYSPVMQIQINQKVNPPKAASLLMQNLIEASGTTCVRQFLKLADATELDIKLLQQSNEVGFANAAGMAATLAELYVSGVGIVSEPADLVINIDAGFKGNYMQAAIGMIPFLPSGVAKSGLVLKHGDQVFKLSAEFVEKARASKIPLTEVLDYFQDTQKLVRNMEKAGIIRPANTAGHHIVAKASKFPGAVRAREILEKFGIDVNNAANGVYLPNTKDSLAPGLYHPSLHTKAYYAAVAERLENAKTLENVLETLNDIRSELLNGTFTK